MNALVRKEFRLILPAWGVAFVALIAARVNLGFSPDPSEWIILSFCVGMLVLGLTPFGREFSSGSFSSLLSQPFPRGRLWRAKMRHLGSAALTLFCVLPFLWANRPLFYRGPDWNIFWATACTGLAVLTGGLWTTLLLRQITAAFWITLLVPAALALGVSLVTEWLVLRLANVLPAATPSLERIIPVAISAVFVLYSIAGYWWARRLFLRAQDVGWAVVEAPVPGFARWFKVRTRPVGEPSHRPLRALAVKELQLHSLSLFFAAGVLLLHLAAIGVRKFGSESGGWREAANLIWALWFILPFIAGAEAVASERQLGTMESQLCLPARRRTQFACKLLFTLLAGVFLGGVIPWLLENFASLFGVGAEVLKKFYAEHSVWEHSNLAALMGWSAIAGGMALIAFHASTLTRSTLQAMGGAVVGWILVWVLILFGTRPEVLAKMQLWRGWIFHLIGGLTLIPVVIGLAYWNFKRLHQSGQLWRRNLAVLGVWLAFTLAATALVYHRAWELVLPLEPQHGPARIPSDGRAVLCRVERPNPLLYMVLLPDGRIWAGTEGAIVQGTEIRLTAGQFVDGSNWIALAANRWEAAAIKADGGLWVVSCSSPPSMQAERHLVAGLKPPENIGNDSDWASLSASEGHFLALKQDGSIWGWGANDSSQLGDYPSSFTRAPVRIGQESDWTAVFAEGSVSAGVKRDGSLWVWGGLSHLPDGTQPRTRTRQTTPVRWNLPGTNLVSFRQAAWADCDFALYRDGSVLATRRMPAWLPGKLAIRGGRAESPPAAGSHPFKSVRVNDGESWRAFSVGQSLLSLHADGSLWDQAVGPHAPQPSRPKKRSNHSDWLSVTATDTAIVALAADGTLCCWRTDSSWSDPRAWLAPSRHPLWSLNILDSVR